MRTVELNHVEYGECVVLCGNQSMLMVDCGSMNHKIRKDGTRISQRFDEIAERYLKCTNRQFLLSHYHRDHICGFLHILSNNPDYFNRVFLPYAPVSSGGRPALLEYALYAYLFQSHYTDSTQVGNINIQIFQQLSGLFFHGALITLSAEDCFRFDGVDYEVLWPPRQDFPFDVALENLIDELDMAVISAFNHPINTQKAFIKYKYKFLSLYLKCCEICSGSSQASFYSRQSIAIQLQDTLEVLENMRDAMQGQEVFEKIQELLFSETALRTYSDGLNGTSLVFQNIRPSAVKTNDILMTGDCPSSYMDRIVHKLYDSYYILKAPHHGTASGFHPIFKEISFAHILISNGDFSPGGTVSQEYLDMDLSIRHCTNHSACSWYEDSGCCCNRLSCCYDQSHEGRLALYCRAARGAGNIWGCRIATVLHEQEYGCFCDM